MIVNINANLVEETAALLPITDRSYLYGEGFFESFRAYKNNVPFLELHWERLLCGVEFLEAPFDWTYEKFKQEISRTLVANSFEHTYVRVHLSWQNQSLKKFERSSIYNVVILVRPMDSFSEVKSWKTKVISEFLISPTPWHLSKSANYLFYLWAKREAQSSGFDEALLCNSSGRVVEGSSTNLFCFDGAKWITPMLSEGVLSGVTRKIVLQLFEEHQQPFAEARLEVNDVLKSKEIFLTNSVRGIIPVASINGESLKTTALTEKWIEIYWDKFKSQIT